MRSFILVVLVTAGCGSSMRDPIAVCAAACLGCCDAAGTCHSGNASTACGVSGRFCAACRPEELCSAGACLSNVIPSGGGSAGGGAAGGAAFDAGVRFDAGVIVQTTQCVGRLVECRQECVDPQIDESNCGACGVRCAAGLVCSSGQCRPLPNDCVNDRCPDDFGCNPQTRQCDRSCFSDADCRVSGSTCSNGSCRCGSFGSPQCSSCDFQSSNCECPSGYRTDLARGCSDIDECATPDRCGPAAAATCVNRLGSFECRCKPGFTMWNNRCERDLCATNNGGCAPAASCRMVTGTQVSCTCPFGFIGDGRTCKQTCSLSGSAVCGVGSACYPDPSSSGSGVCERAGSGAPGALCSNNADCRGGTHCEHPPGSLVGHCAPLCSADWGCASTERCVFRSSFGVCLKRNSTPGCDLLKQDCEQGCYLAGPSTQCSWAGSQTAGACTYANDCAIGYVCEGPNNTWECKRLCDPNAPQCGSCASFLSGIAGGVCQ